MLLSFLYVCLSSLVSLIPLKCDNVPYIRTHHSKLKVQHLCCLLIDPFRLRSNLKWKDLFDLRKELTYIDIDTYRHIERWNRNRKRGHFLSEKV